MATVKYVNKRRQTYVDDFAQAYATLQANGFGEKYLYCDCLMYETL